METLDRFLYAATLVAISVTCSCADRDRNNPFDPLNPNTGGSPYLFEAIADNGRAHLSWSVEELLDLEGFTLIRTAIDGSDSDSARYNFGLGRTSFTDTDLSNSITYLYELAFVFDGMPAWTNNDTVTPGSTIPWVLDGYAGVVTRLSPDGRDRAATFMMSSVFSDLDVVESNGTAWVADYFNKKVFHVDKDGKLLDEITLTGYPVSIAIDDSRARVWISQSSPGSIVRLTAGAIDTTYEIEDYPLSLSVDEERGTLWASSSRGGWVMKMDDSGMHFTNGFISPMDIEFDPISRTTWVACATEVVSLTREFEVILRKDGFNLPSGIAVDHTRGIVWIADTGNARIVKISQDGNILITVYGFNEPYAIAVDVDREEVWVTDSYSGEVVRVSGEGRILKRKGGFLSPFGVGIIP